MTDYRSRAKELLVLALGAGITINQSIDLMAEQLEKWDNEDHAQVVENQSVNQSVEKST